MKKEERIMKGEGSRKREDGRRKKRPDRRLEDMPVVKTLSGLNGMVHKPKKILSLEEMDEAIAKGANQ